MRFGDLIFLRGARVRHMAQREDLIACESAIGQERARKDERENEEGE